MMASSCFEYSDERRLNLAKARAAPLEDKIHYTLAVIRQFYIARRGQVYVSYSGGKDSTVLLDLVRSVYPDVPAVFIDTGLEFPEVRAQVAKAENVEVIRPSMSFRRVIETTGYPVVSKEVSCAVAAARRGADWGLNRMDPSNTSRFGHGNYASLVDAPFPVSNRCCEVMKKAPAHRYEAETGRAPYIGTRADESSLRRNQFETFGEIREGKKRQTCNPLSIWTEDDVWTYIRDRGLSYPDVYDRGWSQTGCIFCCFGIMQDRNRFLRLKATHPRQWEYCMRDWSEGGLGMREVLEWLGIPTGCEQTDLRDFCTQGFAEVEQA